MSAFLGPIHFWLYNKVKLHEMLENDVIIAFKRAYGYEINGTVKSAYDRYGQPFTDKPLGQLIDTANIHGWLSEKIAIVETRQAAILSEIFKKHGEGAVEIALRLYSAQGSDCGMDAKANHPVSTAPEIFKAINNFLLDGMPCDMVNTITVNTDDKVEWQNVQCLHRGYWEAVNADIDTFYKLRAEWIRSFVKGANEKFTYNVNRSKIGGEEGFIHEIIKS
jgi:uncharacterized protein YjhX (UPF0386 family)